MARSQPHKKPPRRFCASDQVIVGIGISVLFFFFWGGEEEAKLFGLRRGGRDWDAKTIL